MIGRYINAQTQSRVTISPAVPGAQYRITAWAFGDGRRSVTPAVANATTEEEGELNEHEAIIGRYSRYILIQHILAIITVSIRYALYTPPYIITSIWSPYYCTNEVRASQLAKA